LPECCPVASDWQSPGRKVFPAPVSSTVAMLGWVPPLQPWKPEPVSTLT
jgi:hypothetical protein